MAKKGDEYISTDHFLLALTGKGSGVADLLPGRDALEKAIGEVRPHRVTSPEPEATAQALEKFGRDLTAEAEAGRSRPNFSSACAVASGSGEVTRCGRTSPIAFSSASRPGSRSATPEPLPVSASRKWSV